MENNTMTMVVALLVLIMWSHIAIFLAKIIFRETKTLIQIYQNNKLFKQKTKECEAMLASGEMYDWISAQIQGKNAYICRKTGWCPNLETFFPVELVAQYDKEQKRLARYEIYAFKRVNEIAQEYGMNNGDIKGIVDKVARIEVEFIEQEE
jgi:hypothetical protein